MVREYYQVNEFFTSVQGEGVLSGRRATFVRLQGCTVGCSWCDSGPLADLRERRSNGETRNTWGRGGQKMSVPEIVSIVESGHVIITGGEPTLYNLDPLIHALHEMDCFVQLETSGQNELKGQLQVDWLTWSPKQNLQWNAPESIMRAAKEVKWVIEHALPFKKLQETWEWYLANCSDNLPEFVLMPEGCPPTSETIGLAFDYLQAGHEAFGESAMRHWRFGDRMQYRLGVR